MAFHLQPQKIFNMIKIAVLAAIWMVLTGVLMSNDEKILIYHQLAIPIGQNKSELAIVLLDIATIKN